MLRPLPFKVPAFRRQKIILHFFRPSLWRADDRDQFLSVVVDHSHSVLMPAGHRQRILRRVIIDAVIVEPVLCRPVQALSLILRQNCFQIKGFHYGPSLPINLNDHILHGRSAEVIGSDQEITVRQLIQIMMIPARHTVFRVDMPQQIHRQKSCRVIWTVQQAVGAQRNPAVFQ